jgi:hypothetical protein
VTLRLKFIESLTASDLANKPVWKLTNRDGASEVFVHTVTTIPVKNQNGKVVGAQIRLANGSEAWARFGNVDSVGEIVTPTNTIPDSPRRRDSSGKTSFGCGLLVSRVGLSVPEEWLSAAIRLNVGIER